MAVRLEHAQAGQLERERGLGREARHREPLRRHRDAVLAAGVADLGRADAPRARELARHLLRGAQPLLDPHEGVAPLPARRVERDLVDPEVLGLAAQAHHQREPSSTRATGANERRWTGEGPRRRSAARCCGVE